MNQVLGFITALFVTGWALRWYFRSANPTPKPDWQPPLPGSTPASKPAVTRWEPLADVTVEQSLEETRTLPGAMPRLEYEPAGEVERRLEALVEADDDLPAPLYYADTAGSETLPPAEPVTISFGESDSAPEPAVESESASGDAPAEDAIIGFCARCRDKREVLNPTRTQTKKGKAAIRGNCAVCGAGMFVFVSESA